MIIIHEQDDDNEAFAYVQCEQDGEGWVLETMSLQMFRYLIGETKPNYPLPAIRQRTFESLRKLGYSSAENAFPLDIVFDNYIKL